MRTPRFLAVLLAISAITAVACSPAEEGDATADASETTSTTGPTGSPEGDDAVGAAEPYSSAVYAQSANWLCRPDVEGDACDADLDATFVAADGTRTVEPFVAAEDPPVDCFYVYPTVSDDPGANSDLVPSTEIAIAEVQAARFAEVCDVYAPMYRQIPLGALAARLNAAADPASTSTTLAADDPANPRNIAYADVADAFAHYMANDNDGRPFVLIGHSQGAGQLWRLLSDEIDDDPQLREQMLSAMLIGTAVPTEGPDTLDNVPPCGAADDTGCVISYASFYAEEPPPADSLFGRVRDGGGQALCTNPAALGGGAGPLNSYFGSGHVAGAPEVDTPYVRYEGLLEGDCVSDDFDWLALTNTATEGVLPTDTGGRLTPQWGTHLIDVNVALGDLIDIVSAQSGQAGD